MAMEEIVLTTGETVTLESAWACCDKQRECQDLIVIRDVAGNAIGELEGMTIPEDITDAFISLVESAIDNY